MPAVGIICILLMGAAVVCLFGAAIYQKVIWVILALVALGASIFLLGLQGLSSSDRLTTWCVGGLLILGGLCVAGWSLFNSIKRRSAIK